MKKSRIISIVAVILVITFIGGYFSIQHQLDQSDLPKLYFEGNISEMQKKSDIRNIRIEYKSDSYSFSGYAEIKVQGTSSLVYEKKNYTITLFKDEKCSEKLKVDVGWGAQNKYCLKANWIDKTHARNIVTANLVTQIQSKYNVLSDTPANGAIDGFPVEIFSNGEFLGLYTFNIPKDAWMFNMNKDNPNHIVFCGENWNKSIFFDAKPTFDVWSIEVGPENSETLSKLSKLFDFIQNSSDEDFIKEFESYVDLDSAIHYYIMVDFAYLTDNRGKNMLLATYDGNKWYPLLYDLDTSWGTDYNGKALWDYHNEVTTLPEKSLLFSRLEKCFGAEIRARYFELRQDILTKENVLKHFNEFIGSIPSTTLFREKLKWGLEIPGYDISQIEEYLDCTIERLDKEYEQLS